MVSLHFNYSVFIVLDDFPGRKEMGVLSFLKKIEDAYIYYSTPEHLKELFVVPYHPKPTNRLRDKVQNMMHKGPGSGEKVSVHVADLSKG